MNREECQKKMAAMSLDRFQRKQKEFEVIYRVEVSKVDVYFLLESEIRDCADLGLKVLVKRFGLKSEADAQLVREACRKWNPNDFRKRDWRPTAKRILRGEGEIDG